MDSQAQVGCDKAIIYNTETQCWYITTLARCETYEDVGWTAGAISHITGNGLCGVANSDFVGLCFMEVGPQGESVEDADYVPVHDAKFILATEIEEGDIRAEDPMPLDAWFQTPWYSLFASNPQANVLLSLRRIEPDFVQTGEMTVSATFKMYPKSCDTSENPPVIIPVPPASDKLSPGFPFLPDTERIDDVVGQQGRFMSLTFRSQTLGGKFMLGQTLLHIEEGEANP